MYILHILLEHHIYIYYIFFIQPLESKRLNDEKQLLTIRSYL